MRDASFTKSSGTDAPADPRRLALRPKEAAAAIGIGTSLLWTMTRRGEVPHIKLGKAILYPVAALEGWLMERANEGRR